jgi:hypothetical protein
MRDVHSYNTLQATCRLNIVKIILIDNLFYRLRLVSRWRTSNRHPISQNQDHRTGLSRVDRRRNSNRLVHHS